MILPKFQTKLRKYLERYFFGTINEMKINIKDIQTLNNNTS